MGGARNGNGKRSEHTLKATIEQMDNGAQMVIRKHSSATQQGIITLKKVYTDFDSLAKDLATHMHFNFEKGK
jgi:hypothetical protein